MLPIIEFGYCNDCEIARTAPEAEKPCPLSDDHTHDFTYNGCVVCEGDHWIMNDVDDSGPWRCCPGCNASGNIPSPYVFVDATELDAAVQQPAAQTTFNLRSYHWEFQPTGNAGIDALLAAVAGAAKGYHNVGDWTESYGDSLSPLDEIQQAANRAAQSKPAAS